MLNTHTFSFNCLQHSPSVSRLGGYNLCPKSSLGTVFNKSIKRVKLETEIGKKEITQYGYIGKERNLAETASLSFGSRSEGLSGLPVTVIIGKVQARAWRQKLKPTEEHLLTALSPPHPLHSSTPPPPPACLLSFLIQPKTDVWVPSVYCEYH